MSRALLIAMHRLLRRLGSDAAERWRALKQSGVEVGRGVLRPWSCVLG